MLRVLIEHERLGNVDILRLQTTTTDGSTTTVQWSGCWGRSSEIYLLSAVAKKASAAAQRPQDADDSSDSRVARATQSDARGGTEAPCPKWARKLNCKPPEKERVAVTIAAADGGAAANERRSCAASGWRIDLSRDLGRRGVSTEVDPDAQLGNSVHICAARFDFDGSVRLAAAADRRFVRPCQQVVDENVDSERCTIVRRATS